MVYHAGKEKIRTVWGELMKDIYERIVHIIRRSEKPIRIVRITKDRKFSIERQYLDTHFAGVEVYYQVKGKDVDCCTLPSWLTNKELKDLREFVDMYR